MPLWSQSNRTTNARQFNPRRTRVLIVEDSSNDALLVKQGLEVSGVRDSYTVKTGEEALDLLARKPCDVALVDYHLPYMSGLDLLSIIKDRWPAMRVIMVTGARDEQVAVAAMKLGAADYISKDDYLTSGLVTSLQNVIHDIEGEREAVLTVPSSVQVALSETEWLASPADFSVHSSSGVRLPDESGVDAEVVRNANLYIRASAHDLLAKAAPIEDRLVALIMHQGLSPRDIVLAWRDALKDVPEPHLPFNPTLLLAHLLRRTLEEYQTYMAISSSEEKDTERRAS